METVEKYREIIHRLLQEYHDFLAEHTKTDVETEIVSDDVHGQYAVMRVGWRGERRVRKPTFYLRLKNGKIWIEEDWTKDGIAQDLIDAGVPRSAIVLAFQPPFLRVDTEFAPS